MAYYRQYDADAASRAKQMRQEMTAQERRLWYAFLRTYPVKFYRKRAIEKYILDFYCSRAKLAIQIHGDQHNENDRDPRVPGTDDLLGMGITLLQFSSADIDRNFKAVCNKIDQTVKNRLPDQKV